MARIGALTVDQNIVSQIPATQPTALTAAFAMVLATLGVPADAPPPSGSIVRMGSDLVAGVTGVAVSAVVIACAWIVYRPIVAVILLALVAALVGVLVWRAPQARARAAVAAS